MFILHAVTGTVVETTSKDVEKKNRRKTDSEIFTHKRKVLNKGWSLISQKLKQQNRFN